MRNRFHDKKKILWRDLHLMPFFTLVFLIGTTQLVLAAGSTEPVTRNVFAMDTYMTLTIYGEHADEVLDLAEKEIQQLDALLSTGNPESEISKLNETGEAILEEHASFLLERSLEVNQLTQGAFNPLIYPLMEAWGFTDSNYRIPSQEEIDALLPLTDVSNIDFDQNTKKLSFEKEGMKMDLGGIAKGYTSSRIIDLFAENNVSSAVISLGGNVQTLGKKPDGSPWKVAIIHPANDGSFLGILETHDQAVITSGGYERYFEQGGKTWHHILDPSTGYPADQGLTSVTIISPDGTLADSLSTALFVQGLENAIATWKENPNLFEAVLFTKDQKVYITEGIAKDFSTTYPMQVISRK